MHAKDRWNTNGKCEMKDRKNCDRDEIEMLACKQRKLEQSGGETWFRAWFMPEDMTVLEKVGIRGTLDLETTQRRKEITPAVVNQLSECREVWPNGDNSRPLRVLGRICNRWD
ncbi:hypothetical protein K0M31_010011 [Melipona bicolor]|uniref:Uncharacterized protein n=1 Tax=Melipona bicolor TaxID=60889 RepID=A0AA40FMA7_9HYME|nr:hypothetical protein K0M31_010011 [Melipona bicolor]